MVDGVRNALYQVKKVLYQYKILITREQWVNHERQAIIKSINGIGFFVSFKRDFFHSYGQITGNQGIGETINVEDFEYAVYEKDVEQFLFVYPGNAIYKIRSADVKKNSFLYTNKADGKQQYLFSVKILQRLQ